VRYMTERIAGIPPYSSTPPVSVVRKSFPKKKTSALHLWFHAGVRTWAGLVRFGFWLGRLSYHIPIETEREVKDCTKKANQKVWAL